MVTSLMYFVIPNILYIRRPYVGIIQIRFSVEGHTFLSACIQAPVCLIVEIIIHLFTIICKRFLQNDTEY